MSNSDTEDETSQSRSAPRARSSVAFPYYSLDKSIDVPRVIHQRAGGRCGRGQLAGLLGYSGVKNGGFATRISAAKMFGLIEESGESISLTDRARKILSPVRPSDAEQAKLDAFMSVELFRKVFEDFEGHTLPGPDGLQNLFLTEYKIVPKQVASALRNLMESADSAGLFDLGGRTKLIRPIIRPESSEQSATPTLAQPGTTREHPPAEIEQEPQHTFRTKATLTGANPDLNGVHPALVGLIQNLPPIGSTIGPKRRAALIDAFKHTVNFVYPEEEEG